MTDDTEIGRSFWLSPKCFIDSVHR